MGLIFSAQMRSISRSERFGERDVAAGEEAQSGVVVLEIERAAQALRELVYEAEEAVVGAAPGLVHEVFFKVEAEVVALVLPDLDGVLVPRPAGAQRERELGLVGPVAVVEHVLHGVPVYGEQLVPHMHPAPRRAVVVYIGNGVQHDATQPLVHSFWRI